MAWYHAVKLYIMLNLAIRGVELTNFAANSGIAPARLLVGSFLFLILVGAGLLMLPRAVPTGHRPLSFEDALFTPPAPPA